MLDNRKPKQKLGKAPDSRILGENLEAVGNVRPPNSAAHHIVAGGASDEFAQNTRLLLKKAGIDINEAANGVFLPRNSKYVIDETTNHAAVHTKLYYRTVYQRLSRVELTDIRDELGKIAKELQEGRFPY